MFRQHSPLSHPVRTALCHKEPSIKLVNSFLLVGGVVTANGISETEHRDKRVHHASTRLKRGRYAPLAFSQRTHMVQTGIIPVALFGSR
jgi:hypothetical protein